MFNTRVVLLSIIFVSCCLNAAAVFAQDPRGPGSVTRGSIICVACGDPYTDYVDYGNFAFNAMHGADPWVNVRGGATIPGYYINVVNLDGSVVRVHVSAFASIGIPVAWSTVEIRVVLPNGVIEEYDVPASSAGSDLEVGGPRSTSEGGGNNTIPVENDNYAGNDDDYGYYDDYGDYWDGWEDGYGGRIPKRGRVTCDPACY